VSWSLDAHDLDLLAVQADERLLTAVGARRHVEVADPVIAVLSALARDVDTRPIPTGRLTGLRLVGQPTGGAGRRANRRAALTGVAAAVAVLSIGGVAAAVGGTPVSSVIKDTVGSVFDGGSGPSTAELVSAKLGDANAALARGDAQRARQILEDIKAQVAGSDPGEVPPNLVEQVNNLETQLDAELPLPDPAVTSPPPAIVPPAGTNGGEASQPADTATATHGNGKGRGTNQGQGGQGQNGDEDGATPTSEPTSPPPSDPASSSPAPSPDPTPSPSSKAKDHGQDGKGSKDDSGGAAQSAGTAATASTSVKQGRGKPPPGSQGHHNGSAAQAGSNDAVEQGASSPAP
jgi:hypothetical protein